MQRRKVKKRNPCIKPAQAAQNRHEPPSRSGRRFFCCKRHMMPDLSLLAAMAAFSLRAG